MDKHLEETLSQQRNMVYYNQILSEERKRKAKEQRNNKAHSFSSQHVDLRDFFYLPENWEFAAYSFYIVALPYLAGALFLFFAIAHGSFEHFKLLNISAFFIVWLIGYEIITVISLIWIFILYLKYEPS